MASMLLPLLCLSSIALALFSPQSPNAANSLDPLTASSHGRMPSSSRVILKLDCPSCLVYSDPQHTDVTALVSTVLRLRLCASHVDLFHMKIYDFTLAPRSDHNVDPRVPQIFLNRNPFYPPNPSADFTSITSHTALVVSGTTTIDSYLARPQKYIQAEATGTVHARPVANVYGLDLTRIQLSTSAYISAKENTLENRVGNIDVVEIFLLKTNHSVAGRGSTEREKVQGSVAMDTTWTLEWWRIVPMETSSGNERPDTGGAGLPDGLRDKLLENGSGAGAVGREDRGESEVLHIIRTGLVFLSALGAGYVLLTVMYALGRSGMARYRRRKLQAQRWKPRVAWTKAQEGGLEEAELLLDIEGE